MNKWLQTLLLSCLKATFLVEKEQVSGLSATEKAQLKVHLALCKGCKDYKDQSLFIEQSLRQKVAKGDEPGIISEEELNRFQDQILSKLK